MSERTTVEIVVTSPLVAFGRAWPTGEVLQVAPLAASQLIASGRAKLQRIDDLVLLDEAENRNTARVCALESSRVRYRGAR